MKKKEGRRKFIGFLGVILSFPFALLAYLFINKEIDVYKIDNSLMIDLPKSDGFYVKNDYFVIVKNGNVKVLVNHCTHLGCRLLDNGNDKIICPCHGSKFTRDGKLLNGPAMKDLIIPEFVVDKQHKKIKIMPKI